MVILNPNKLYDIYLIKYNHLSNNLFLSSSDPKTQSLVPICRSGPIKSAPVTVSYIEEA